ncbi:UNVERIFIED_CONTAM: hypothetical protein GTU68_009267 [Idotea baltica]|nr:hypothetical protein [Idotea baltica]
MLIDSHCHLDFEVFDADREAILARCDQLGIHRIIVPAVMVKTWDRLLSLTQNHDQLYPALGLHPMFMTAHSTVDIEKLQHYVDRFKPIAIGEIGLDFYATDQGKKQQITLFEQQLRIAVSAKLPVILHVRKAHDQAIQSLKKFGVKGGIVHAFNGSEQQAESYIKQGFLLGIGGNITYDRATRTRQLFSQLPLSAIALETDAPDMPLQGQTASHNSPEAISIIADSLATLRSETKHQIASATSQNVNQLFNLASFVQTRHKSPI